MHKLKSPRIQPDVVADVGKYRLFLPYCKDSVVLRTTPPNFMLVRRKKGNRAAQPPIPPEKATGSHAHSLDRPQIPFFTSTNDRSIDQPSTHLPHPPTQPKPQPPTANPSNPSSNPPQTNQPTNQPTKTPRHSSSSGSTRPSGSATPRVCVWTGPRPSPHPRSTPTSSPGAVGGRVYYVCMY
jgi:hypothetical protein